MPVDGGNGGRRVHMGSDIDQLGLSSRNRGDGGIDLSGKPAATIRRLRIRRNANRVDDAAADSSDQAYPFHC